MRVAAFVDISNLWYCMGRRFPSGKLNYEKLYALAASYGTLIRVTAYGQQVKDEAAVFITCLQKIGYRTRYKEVQQEHLNKWLIRRADWDVGLVMDVVKMADKIDVAVLCTASPTFAPLLKWLQERGTQTVVIGCGISRELKDFTDDWVELGEDHLEIESR